MRSQGADGGFEAGDPGGVERFDVEPGGDLPRRLLAELLAPLFVELDAQNTASAVADVDARRFAQTNGKGGVAFPAHAREIEKGSGFVHLGLRTEDSGGSARSFGSRNASLENEHTKTFARERE